MSPMTSRSAGAFAVLILALAAFPAQADSFDCRGCIDRGDVGKNQVRKKHFRKNTIVSKAVRDESLKGKDLADGTVTAAKLDPSLLQRPQNVVTVSRSGGDFTDPRAALDAITDASDGNPYLVYIGPGTYDLGSSPLQMKWHVAVHGSGRDLTFLTGTVSAGGDPPVAGLVIGTGRGATLRDLTVDNRGAGTYVAGIVNLDLGTDASPVERVTVRATGGTQINWGIYNRASSPALTDVEAQGTGGLLAIGVHNETGSSPTIVRMQSIGFGGSSFSYGVLNNHSSPLIRDSFLAGQTKGVINAGAGNPRILNTRFLNGVAGSATCQDTFDTSLDPVPCP